MIHRLNLSSVPFRNRTMPWLLSAGILFISVIAAVFMYAKWASVKSDLDLVKTSSQSIEDNLKKYQEQEERVKQQLTPDQEQLLIASHRLVLRKNFSWSRLFTDLENVLPGGVSVSQVNVIDVNNYGQRIQAEIEFGVLSYRYENVVGMIDNMNSSGLFRAELRGQDRQKSDGGDFTEYTLYLLYTPHYYIAPTQPDSGTQSASNTNPEVNQ